jgi:hypothetical protein
MLHGRRHPPKKKKAKLCEEDALEGFYESVISSLDWLIYGRRQPLEKRTKERLHRRRYLKKRQEVLHGPRPIASSEESIYFGIINSASNNKLRIS